MPEIEKNEITIEITNYCPNDCPFCSSDSSKSGKPLAFETIKAFLEANIPKGKEFVPYFDVINISGGEPVSHPDFYKILTLCDLWAKDVVVHTNAFKHIRFNAYVQDELRVDANVCLAPGISIRIPQGSFEVHYLDFIPQGRGKSIKPVPRHYSGNLTGNCASCRNLVLTSVGKVAPAPCKKEQVNA